MNYLSIGLGITMLVVGQIIVEAAFQSEGKARYWTLKLGLFVTYMAGVTVMLGAR